MEEFLVLSRSSSILAFGAPKFKPTGIRKDYRFKSPFSFYLRSTISGSLSLAKMKS